MQKQIKKFCVIFYYFLFLQVSIFFSFSEKDTFHVREDGIRNIETYV